MHTRIELALSGGSISITDLQSMAGQAMSISAAIRPASLYTQAMFAVSMPWRSRVSQRSTSHFTRRRTSSRS